jgi:hypothetical protein
MHVVLANKNAELILGFLLEFWRVTH